MSEQFDSWLEEQLHSQLSTISATAASPDASRYHERRGRRSPMLLIRGLLAATGAKVVVGGAVAVLAASTAAGVVTHSANPVSWGHQVTQAVQDCKDHLAAGTHGIGGCVSAFAKSHGDADTDRAGDHDTKTDGKSEQPNGKGDEGKSGGAHGAHAAGSTGSSTAEGKSDQSRGHGGEGKSDLPHGSSTATSTTKPGRSDTHPTPPARP